MALVVSTDLTVIASAEVAETWTGIQTSGGSTVQDEPDFFAQGLQSKSRAVTGTGVYRGAMYDNGSAIDFTTGADQDKLVYIWMRTNVPTLNATRESAGVFVRLGTTSATAGYREWYVDGSDTVQANDGWICYVIDPQSAGSTTNGGYSAASVRYFGGGATTTTTAKGQNWGVDRISYGRGELYVSGTQSVEGEGFEEISQYDWGTIDNRYGIITKKAGVFYVRGKIIIGSLDADTTFSSRGEVVVFETPAYGNGGSPTEAFPMIPNASVGGALGADGKDSYLGLAFRGGDVGSPGGNTSITLGAAVGSDSGRSGPTFIVQQNEELGARTTATLGTNHGTLSLGIYATTFVGFEGEIDLYGDWAAADPLYACTFNSCGQITTNMQVRNCNVLNSVAAAPSEAAWYWVSGQDMDSVLFANNDRAILFDAGSPSFVEVNFNSLTFSGNTVDVRNATNEALTINVLGGTAPSYENEGESPTTSSTTLVINPVTLTVTARDAATLGTLSNVRVFLWASDGTGPLPYQDSVSISRVGGVATVTHTAHGISDGKYVWITGAQQIEFNGVHQITVINDNSYSYAVDGSPDESAGGTPVATGVLVFGVTNAVGVISDTRSYGSDQPFTGRARRSSLGSPIETLYKTSQATGTVDSGAGLSTTVLLVRDE